MNDLLTIYAILMTSLFVVFVDYSKCIKNKKINDVVIEEDSSTENENDIVNTFCSNKPIVAYGGTFNVNHRNEKSDRFKGRANTI
jgi:hypothetical protein